MTRTSDMTRVRRARGVASVRDPEAGVAMVVAIAVIGMVTLVVMILINVALRESRMTGDERQRGVAIASAEGQVDYLIAQIHSRAIGSLGPFCGTIAPIVTSVASDKLAITSGVQYFDATNAVIPCDVLTTGAREATTARVFSTSTSTPKGAGRAAVRTFETVIRLKLDTKLNKAIFGSSSIEITNDLTIVTGSGGASNADLYSKGDVSCKGTVHGSIYSQGSVYLRGECKRIDGQVVAKNGITGEMNSGTLAGDLSVSAGSIDLKNTPLSAVMGKARASGTVMGDKVCPFSPDKCIGNVIVDPPPVEPFPRLSWNPAEWAAAGYTNVVNLSTCGGTDTAGSVANWLRAYAETITVPTALVTDCMVSVQNLNGNSLKLNSNVAIFAKGGFLFNGATVFVSTDSSKIRDLYLIQPWVTPNCVTTGIHFNNEVGFDSSVHALVYTPHRFYSDGKASMSGQIYSECSADMNNTMSLNYRPMPVWGVTNKEAMSYRADIIAKRETQG